MRRRHPTTKACGGTGAAGRRRRVSLRFRMLLAARRSPVMCAAGAVEVRSACDSASIDRRGPRRRCLVSSRENDHQRLREPSRVHRRAQT